MGLKAVLKKSRITYNAANVLRRAPYPFLSAYMRLCRGLGGIDGKKVYFSSFGGKLYNENPKYVCEALHELCPEAKLVFRLSREGRRDPDIPGYVLKTPQFSPAALFHMATARVIVKNACMMPYMRKFPGQAYIQLWHGDRGIKKILMDQNPSAVKDHIDWKLMDIGVSASDFGTENYMRRGFAYRGEVMECGYPKNDLLIANPQSVRDSVKSRLNLPDDTKFLLYAPTFRNNTTGAALTANFSLNRLQAALERETGEKWMILTRGHTLNGGVRADAGMDVSAYPDVSRLLLICDMLVTDYSSIAGDFLLLNRPIILYLADRQDYCSERSLVFDPDDSPYRVAHNEDELIDIACHFGDAEENCRKLAEFYGMKESGGASMAVAERIKEILGGTV